MVPAYKAVDVGLDRSLVGAYGQDDRVCAYTALMAETETKAPAHTTLTILADKEEIGSAGNTGLNSDFVLHIIEDLCQTAGADLKTVLKGVPVPVLRCERSIRSHLCLRIRGEKLQRHQ